MDVRPRRPHVAGTARRDVGGALRVTGVALVTGAAGLVGSRLAERFLREGLSVRALDRHAFDLVGAECIVADVADPGEMQRATTGVALVAHCAAVISGTPDQV